MSQIDFSDPPGVARDSGSILLHRITRVVGADDGAGRGGRPGRDSTDRGVRLLPLDAVPLRDLPFLFPFPKEPILRLSGRRAAW